MAFGTLTDKATGLPIEDFGSGFLKGRISATALVGADGFYIFYDGQACNADDGIAGGCSDGASELDHLELRERVQRKHDHPNPWYRIEPDDAQRRRRRAPQRLPGRQDDGRGQGRTTWIAKNPPSYDFGVAKGTGYSRDWRFTP